MSAMCKMNGKCETTHGLCVHEKTMLVMVVLAVVAGAGFWFLK